MKFCVSNFALLSLRLETDNFFALMNIRLFIETFLQLTNQNNFKATGCLKLAAFLVAQRIVELNCHYEGFAMCYW